MRQQKTAGRGRKFLDEDQDVEEKTDESTAVQPEETDLAAMSSADDVLAVSIAVPRLASADFIVPQAGKTPATERTAARESY